jgi:hypothetical protein
LKTVPKFYHQLFSTHGLSNGHYVPISFFLLPKKHPAPYEVVFTHTVSEAAKLCVNVFPPTVYAEIQTAIHQTVTAVWPAC